MNTDGSFVPPRSDGTGGNGLRYPGGAPGAGAAGSFDPAPDPAGPPPFAPPSQGARRRGRRSAPRREGPTLLEAAMSAWNHALELGEHARALIGIRADRAAFEVRKKANQTAFFAVLGLAAGTIVIAGSLRFVVGLADGLTVLFQGRAWLGDLTAGVLLLAGFAVAGMLYTSRWEKKQLQKHLEKYERFHREHDQPRGEAPHESPEVASRSARD